MAMIPYVLGILPLIRDLWTTDPGVTQPWYDDDPGAGVPLSGIWGHLDDLVVRLPPGVYFPEPTKIILVMSLRNSPQVKAFF